MSGDFFPATVPEGRTPVYFFTRNYYPTLTGAVERFRRYLPGLSERGIDYHVVSSLVDPTWHRVERRELENILRLPVKDGQFVTTETLLLPMVPDLERAARGTIQVAEVTPGMRAPLKHLRKLGHRVLCVRTIMPSIEPPRFSLRGLKRLVDIRLEASACDRFTAGSTVMRDAFSLGSDSLNRKYTIIPHGIDLTRFHPADDAAASMTLRHKLGLRESANVILSVGSVMERKRTHLVVEAFRALNRINPDTQLVIVGENKSRDTLFTARQRDSFQNYCERVSASAAECAPGSVVFTGETNNIEDYYRAADIFLFTSAIEGMPNVVIEAMASGLPCVLTPFKGLPVTEFGASGREFILADADASAIHAELMKLVSDPGRREALGGAARRFTKSNLSSEDAVNAYAALYHDAPASP